MTDYHRIALNHVSRHEGEIDANPFDTPPEAIDLVEDGFIELNEAGKFVTTEKGRQYLQENPQHPRYDDPLAGGKFVEAVK